MKKSLLFSTVVIFSVIIVFLLIFRQNSTISPDESTEQDTSSTAVQSETSEIHSSTGIIQHETKETEPYIPENHSLITVDSWLKIYSVEKYNGRIALLAENISDEDVEYALLTLETGDFVLTFNISALLRGTKVFLLCNEDLTADIQDNITSWKTENKIVFKNPPVINDDVFNISIENGSVSIKNISDTDISSDIFVYYKEIDNNILNGSVTHRIRISGLKAGAVTFVKADGINKDNCEILFTEYD